MLIDRLEMEEEEDEDKKIITVIETHLIEESTNDALVVNVQ
jgi:hypothetical protein